MLRAMVLSLAKRAKVFPLAHDEAGQPMHGVGKPLVPQGAGGVYRMSGGVTIAGIPRIAIAGHERRKCLTSQQISFFP
jgi:hypothetical protein